MPAFVPSRTSLLPPVPPAVRFLVAGCVVAGLAYLMTSIERPVAKVEEPLPPAAIAVPSLDAKILALADDSNHERRLVIEPEPLRHLLEQSIDVGPTVAGALGRPDQPVPLAELRADPQRWRGRWLFYEGELEYLSGPREGHPNKGRNIYEATLRLRSGDAAMFAFSLPPPPDIAVGSWVRAEGFLWKLRDTTYPTVIDRAPMLVGRELQRDYEKWGPVTTLDTALLATVDDASFALGAPVLRTIEADQCEALWHLAAYVRDTAAARTAAEWHKAGTLNTDHHEALRNGGIARGTPMRIYGSLILRRSIVAPSNPAGVEDWTTAWLQVREYGGTLVPVWVPKRVADLPDRCQLEVRAHFYRWSIYEAENGTSRWAPLFVAADLVPYELHVGRTMDGIGIVLGAVAVVFLGIVFWSQRRHQSLADRHMRKLYELRHRVRRSENAPLSPATPPGEQPRDPAPNGP